MPSILSAILLSLIFTFLAGIHVYWALGGNRGKIAALPVNENNELLMKPGWFECLVVAIGLLSINLLTLIKTSIINLAVPDWLLNYGTPVCSALFLLRAIGDFKYIGFSKRITHSEFARMDTRYYSPLCLIIALLLTLL